MEEYSATSSATDTCPQCGVKGRLRWFIHPGEGDSICEYDENGHFWIHYYPYIDGSYVDFVGRRIECFDCVLFINGLENTDCKNCPNIRRMFYSVNSQYIAYYGENGGNLVWDSQDIENINDIHCASCKTAIRELKAEALRESI